MKRFAAFLLGLLLACMVPTAGGARAGVARDADMVESMRSILAKTQRPDEVALLLSQHGGRFLGYQERAVTYFHTGETVKEVASRITTVGPDLVSRVEELADAPENRLLASAGDKADFTLTMWLYEWRNRNGTYTEQAIINGTWRNTEYRWIDDPADVIDVRWIAGDLVYLSASPFDGVTRDQHTNGIASFTVDDQVKSWDLYVNFRPVGPAAHGKWTNLFANYTHAWWS